MHRLEVFVGSLLLLIFIALGFSQFKLYEQISSIRAESREVYFNIQKSFLKSNELFTYSAVNIYDDESYKGKVFCDIDTESIRLEFLGNFKASFIVEYEKKRLTGLMELTPFRDTLKGIITKGYEKGSVFFFTKLTSRKSEGLISFLLDGRKLTREDCLLFGANSR